MCAQASDLAPGGLVLPGGLEHDCWVYPYAERLIGSMRRECLEHVIVFNERSLQRILRSYVDYYQNFRRHLSLGKDAPTTRDVQPPEFGRVIEMPVVGELHHRYLRKAA